MRHFPVACYEDQKRNYLRFFLKSKEAVNSTASGFITNQVILSHELVHRWGEVDLDHGQINVVERQDA